MDIRLRDHFLSQWRKYFNDSEIPVIFYYSDDPSRAEVASAPHKWNCIICQLAEVRKGRSVAFDKDSVTCGGGKRQLGFTDKIRPNFEYFLSCGIENKMEGERYIRTPELVKEFMKRQGRELVSKKFIVFKRWDKLEAIDSPEVVIFFCTPDVLSGLFTLANFDQDEPNGTFTPFGSGCGSIVYYPYQERNSARPRAVIGMFDPSARPCVPENFLTFSLPFNRLEQMIAYMDESFLITGTWGKIQKRIK